MIRKVSENPHVGGTPRSAHLFRVAARGGEEPSRLLSRWTSTERGDFSRPRRLPATSAEGRNNGACLLPTLTIITITALPEHLVSLTAANIRLQRLPLCLCLLQQSSEPARVTRRWPGCLVGGQAMATARQPRVRPLGRRGSAPRCQAAGAKCQVDFKEMAKTSPKTTPNHGYRLCRNQRKPRFVAERVFCSAFHNDVRCFGLSSKLGDSLQKKFWSSAQVLRNSFGVGEGTVLAF